MYRSTLRPAGNSLSVPAAHNAMDRGWNSYKLIKAWLVLPSPAAEHHEGKQQHCRAFRNCRGVWAPLSGCCWREATGESCMSQFRSESCACSGHPKAVLRGECFPSGKAWIGSLGAGKIQQKGCHGIKKWEVCTLYKNVCTFKHKLSSYHRMYKTEVFSSMRAIINPYYCINL